MAYISVITDEKNSLTKHFALNEDGSIDKKAPGHLVKGTIEAIDVDPVELIEVIKGLTQNQCLCLGVLGEPGIRDIFCTKLGTPNRSKDYLNFFPGSSYLLLDFDESGKTPAEALAILAEIDPQFATCGAAVIPSSSSYLYKEDGTELIGAGNFHIFVEVKGERNAEIYGGIIFDRLMLRGFLYPHVTKSGSIIMKSIIDRSVMSAEREIFSAVPVCDSPLVSKRLEHIEWQVGPAIDADAIPDMDDGETLELRVKFKELRDGLQDEAEKARQAWLKEQAVKKAAGTGSHWSKFLPDVTNMPIYYDKKGRPVMELLSSQEIMLEDGTKKLVRELLLSPENGTKIPDPIEPFKRGNEKKGIPGRGVATILGTMIYSHHHCGIIYLMRWDAGDVLDVLMHGGEDDKKYLWNMISNNHQQLSSMTEETDLSEIVDAFKTYVGIYKEARVGKDKKHIAAKVKVPTTFDDEEDDKILEMNTKYGMVNMAGKAVIVSEHWSQAAGEFETVFSFPTSLDTLYKNVPMRIPCQSQPVSLYKYWEQHKDRRAYEGVTFEPNAHTFREPGKPRVLPAGREYNMFQGYMYSPKKATNCDLILQHIKEVWCSSGETEYKYVISWLAHLFQHPDRLSQTALVMQSVPGAGKGIIIENCIVKALGVHAISSSNQDDLVGRFNVHLGMNIFFYCNEMAYTAQTATKSILKTLVETDTRMIERKNIDKIKARNFTSVIFSANDGWLLNIDFGDRRYVYLTVSSHRKGDVEYFKKLKKQIDEGGKDAFVKYLLEYDIEGFDFTEIPDRQHKQRTTDFLRSAHPAVKFVWMLYNVDIGVSCLANDVSYKTVKTWFDSRTETMILTKAQMFSLYREYCDYYKVERKYDDPMSIEMQLEIGGCLRRKTDPDDCYVMNRVEKKGVEMYEFRSIDDSQQYLKV